MGMITDKGMQGRPTSEDIWLRQPFPRGGGVLMGRIAPAGERLFYFRYSDSKGGRPFLPIGPFHPKGERGLTVAQAYEKAAALSQLYRSGIKDLRAHLAQIETDRLDAEAAERQRLENEQRRHDEAVRQAEEAAQRRITVQQAFERWRSTELQPRVRADGKRLGRKDGGQFVADQFARHVFPLVGEMPLEELRKAELLAVLDRQTAAGKARTANMLLSDLKQMLDFAAERELIPHNPISGVKKAKIGGPSVERDRTLSDDELKILAKAMPEARFQPRSAAAIWLILATACRIGEAMGALWVESLPDDPRKRSELLTKLQGMADEVGVKLGIVDTTAKTWHLPDTKNQRDHTIHLSDFALARLGELKGLREALTTSATGELSPWLFPASDNSYPVCPKSLGKQLADRQRPPERRMTGRSKNTEVLILPGGKWTAHDLRRTAATVMARLGFSRDTVNEVLNHITDDRMSRVYIHDRREADQQRALAALGAHLYGLTLDDAMRRGNLFRLAKAA